MATHLRWKTSVVLCVFLTVSLARSQYINGRFSTSIYSFKKFDTTDVSKVLARGYQTLQLDMVQGDISLQTSLYGATDLSGSFGDDALVRFNNLFLKWRNIGGVLDLSLGRIPVFAGVGLGIVDGALVKARGWNNDVTVVAYGGANVRSDLKSTGFTELGKNFLAGVQIIGNVLEGTRLGLSYVNRNIERDSYVAQRSDSLYNTIQTLVTPDYRAEQVMGADVRYDGSRIVTGYGRYDFDLYEKKNLRTQLELRVNATDRLAVLADYIYREPRLFYNSFFTIFPTHSIREYEGGVEYEFLPALKAFGKFGFVQYTGDASRRFTLGVNTDYASLSYSGTNGYAGLLNSVSLEAMVPLFDRRVIPTLGLSYASYDIEGGGGTTDNVFAASVGGVCRPIEQFSIDAQLQWLENPVMKSDVRLFAKINYWFNQTLNIFRSKEDKND